LSNDIRMKWLNHPIFGPEWRKILQNFDSSTCAVTNVETAPRKSTEPAPGTPPAAPSTAWANEPETTSALEEAYEVVHTFPGRTSTHNFVVTKVDRKDGTATTFLEGQEFKLFLCGISMDTISNMSYVIQASDGRFMKTTAAVQLLATGKF